MYLASWAGSIWSVEGPPCDPFLVLSGTIAAFSSLRRQLRVTAEFSIPEFGMQG